MAVELSVQARRTDSTIFKVDIVSFEINISKGVAIGRGHSQCCSLLIGKALSDTSVIPDVHKVTLGSVPSFDGGGGRV
jgi:hypothetical protein